MQQLETHISSEGTVIGRGSGPAKSAEAREFLEDIPLDMGLTST